ncbi:MAG: YdcF family protein [Bacillota bacterium]|nr:YdcF family protein [Bacillota bacterium]
MNILRVIQKRNEQMKRFRIGGISKKFIKVICIIFLVVAILCSVLFSFILDGAKNSKPRNSDVLIVLGCQIWGEGPSLMLEYRLQNALALYKKGVAKSIIVSGGQGSDEKTSEANVMKKWLIKNKVPEDIIFEEDKSTSTYENLKFSKKIMKEKGFKSAVIVTNDYHIFRALWLGKRLGIACTGAPSQTVEYLKPYYYSREFISNIKSFIFDR